jgi:serine/threonine protein kinase
MPSQRLCTHDGSVLEDTLPPEERLCGQTLAGKYRIEGFLSQGGMGAVYRATHVMLGKPVALKPELVTPKLLDFAIAKAVETDGATLTSTGMVLGTPRYMSPEQAKGASVDGRSDLYSLGIIFYEMLVGHVPFDDPSVPSLLVKHMAEPPRPPSALRPDVPAVNGRPAPAREGSHPPLSAR